MRPKIAAAFTFALFALVGCGCNRPGQMTPAPSVRQKLVQGENAASQPATSRRSMENGKPRRSSRPVAWVNDEPIEQQALVRLLWESRGLALLQQFVLREVSKQEAERLGFNIAADDVNREYDLTLQANRFDGKDPEALTPARREQLIEEWTLARGVTRQELAVAMERQAYLRKIVRGRIEITEAMLRKEYAWKHGEKVEVRHIQLAAPRVWEQVQQRLKNGEDFQNLVADYSQNRLSRRNRGLLPPFTATDPGVPAAFTKVAFALEPGQVSNPIEAQGSYHVLKLERRIPAEDVTFEEVEDELRKSLFARLVAEAMENLGEKLLRQCELRIEDRVLREQYKARHAAGDLVGPPLVGQ